MILFPGISPKVMLRKMFPFIFSTVVIVAVIAAYIHFSDGLCSEVIHREQEQVIRTANSITGIAMDDTVAAVMFNQSQSQGIDYLYMKPEFLASFNMSECMIIYSMQDSTFEGITFKDDSLARSALNSGSPAMQYIHRGKESSLLVFYPVINSSWNTSVSRMVFENVHGDERTGSRYNFFLISAALLVLLILPGSFLKLAQIRRDIEKSGFYRNSDTEISNGNKQIENKDEYLSSFLEGYEFPALFRLDITGAVLYMNNSAEKLIDISKNDVSGIKFHELPCFPVEDQCLIKYPDHEESSEQIIDIIDSSGSSRKVVFRVERLGETGYAVSVKGIGDREDQSPEQVETVSDSNLNDVSAGDLSDSDLQRIWSHIEVGRIKFQENHSFLDYLSGISDLLPGREKYLETQDQGQAKTIEIYSELDAISTALNDVLPERVLIELDVPGFLPEVECSRADFTQIVKNMVFYSLETTTGSVRIKLGARDVPSPVSDSVFSINCDRTVSRSVSMSFTDGTRIPVVLKEALLDPETDLSGIQRDYGSHISSVAAVLSKHDCHPVFTEGSRGTTLNILFRISEDYLFEASNSEAPLRINLSSTKLAICDASRAVRESVSEILTMYGMNISITSSLEEIKKLMTDLTDSGVDFLLLDHSVIDESMGEVIGDMRMEYPDLEIIFTAGFTFNADSLPENFGTKVSILRKPYSIDDLLSIIEMSVSSGSRP
ncbi:MAG: hypothetical protein ABFR50_00325 [Candidatus Fermentibacteria bacterium]